MLNRNRKILTRLLTPFLTSLSLNYLGLISILETQKVLATNQEIKQEKQLNNLAENKQLNNRVGKFILSYQPTNQVSNFKFRIGEEKVIEYPTIEHKKIKQLLEKTAIFDSIINQLNNSGLVMRFDVPVIFTDCGSPNAYWNYEDKKMIICYENMAFDLALFEVIGDYNSDEALDKSINETIFAFYHELGHALIDILPLAAVGQEEDTVDEFASITLLKNSADNNAQIVLDGAEFYKLKNSQPLWWDEHTPDLKRVFNIVCFVYGSSPDKYEKEFIETFLFVNDENHEISKEKITNRAYLCEKDYERKVEKWDKLMIPHYAQQKPNNSGRTSNYPNLSPPKNGESRRGLIW